MTRPTRTLHPHAWVPYDGPEHEEFCGLCGAFPETPSGAAPCREPWPPEGEAEPPEGWVENWPAAAVRRAAVRAAEGEGTDTPPRLDSVPCSCDPAVRALMATALPCRCGSMNLSPVSDADEPPVFAVACDDCGEIDGDGRDLGRAVANWNIIQRGRTEPTAYHPHLWVPYYGHGHNRDSDEICSLCDEVRTPANADDECPEPFRAMPEPGETSDPAAEMPEGWDDEQRS